LSAHSLEGDNYSLLLESTEILLHLLKQPILEQPFKKILSPELLLFEILSGNFINLAFSPFLQFMHQLPASTE